MPFTPSFTRLSVSSETGPYNLWNGIIIVLLAGRGRCWCLQTKVQRSGLNAKTFRQTFHSESRFGLATAYGMLPNPRTGDQVRFSKASKCVRPAGEAKIVGTRIICNADQSPFNHSNSTVCKLWIILVGDIGW